LIVLSKMADYGVVVTVRLVGMRHPDTMTAHALAEDTGLGLSTVAKVLKALARAGVVESVRGAGGGYRLAAPAARITVRAVVAAIDGPLKVTECAVHETTCERTAICATRPHWGRINAAVGAALDSVTIADMAAPAFAFSPQPHPLESTLHDRLA
jgi:FeS assembly SUF system regulator